MLKRSMHTLMLATLLSLGGAATSGITALADELKAPVTVQDHEALAKTYTEKAASYRKEAAFHREMFEAYKKQSASLPKTGPNPWVVKMQKHCDALAKDAEKLASGAQKAAEYHTLRAAELKGK